MISKNKVVVTGAAGFIGSNLIDSLLQQNFHVVGIDNFSTGRVEFLNGALKNPKFEFVEMDLFTDSNIIRAFKDCHTIYHLSANADVRFGSKRPNIDLEQNTITTHNVLEAARIEGITRFIFSSTGSVYGEHTIIPTPENAPFPLQTSLYGASKLACEALIQAYSESFGIQAWIFRFVSILGPRYTHGHIVDFLAQLLDDPNQLQVLGNGRQKKSYLHIWDCIEGIKLGVQGGSDQINIFNLGIDGICEVRDSIGWIIDELKIKPQILFGTELRGWIGDNPIIHLDTKKITKLGWHPSYSIEESVRETVRYLINNQHLLRNRKVYER